MQKVRITFLIENGLVGDFIHAYADKVQIQEIVAVQGVAYNKNTSVAATRGEARKIGEQARVQILECLRSGPKLSGEIVDNFPQYPKPWLRQIIYRLQAEGTLIKLKKTNQYVLRGQPERTEGSTKKKASAFGDVANRLAHKPKKPRPPGGFNFERPEIRAKATANALAKTKKKTATGHHGNGSDAKRPTASSQVKPAPAAKPAPAPKAVEAGRKAVETAKNRGVDFAALGRKGNEAKKLKRQEAALNGTANGVLPSSPPPAE